MDARSERPSEQINFMNGFLLENLPLDMYCYTINIHKMCSNHEKSLFLKILSTVC